MIKNTTPGMSLFEGLNSHANDTIKMNKAGEILADDTKQSIIQTVLVLFKCKIGMLAHLTPEKYFISVFYVCVCVCVCVVHWSF